MGLLLSHKRKLLIYPDMLTVSTAGHGKQVGGGVRGDIQHFSADSRRRLFQLLHKLEFKMVTFCTLTYPGEFPTDPKIYKAHLKEYRRRFELRYNAIQAVWRLEFQVRGAPHYHIMYLDAPFIAIADWCNLWSDVIHTEDENHRKNGVDVKLITSGKEGKLVATYLAKYVAKVDERTSKDDNTRVGRWWGRWNIKEETPVEVEVMDWQAERIVTDLVSDRGGDTPWFPADLACCTLFGDRMGTNDFEHAVIREVGKVVNGGKKRWACN